MGRYFAVLDAGCSDITAVAARWNKGGDYTIEGFCHSPSRGIRRGVVIDVALATDSIIKVLGKLTEKTGKKIHDVYAGISSTSIDIVPSSGVVLLSKYGRDVTERDIKRCVRIGSTVKIPLEKEVLHRIVKGFSVDGEEDIKNPLNLEGVKLTVEMNIVTVNSTVLRNLAKCVSQAGYIPAGFVFSGLVSSYRGLTDEDKHGNIALLDICNDIAEIMVFSNGVLTGCKVLSVGSDDIIAADGNIAGEPMGQLVSGAASLSGWNRVQEVVIIGKGALEDNTIDAMERFFPYRVRAGSCVCKPFEELPQERYGYIGSLGILDYLQEEKNRRKQAGNILKRALNRTLGFIDKYF